MSLVASSHLSEQPAAVRTAPGSADRRAEVAEIDSAGEPFDGGGTGIWTIWPLGMLDEAARYCDRVGAMLGADGEFIPTVRLFLWSLRATLALEANDLHAARTLMARVETLAERAGDLDSAASPFAAALEWHQGLPVPLEEVETLTAYGGNRFSRWPGQRRGDTATVQDDHGDHALRTAEAPGGAADPAVSRAAGARRGCGATVAAWSRVLAARGAALATIGPQL